MDDADSPEVVAYELVSGEEVSTEDEDEDENASVFVVEVVLVAWGLVSVDDAAELAEDELVSMGE